MFSSPYLKQFPTLIFLFKTIYLLYLERFPFVFVEQY